MSQKTLQPKLRNRIVSTDDSRVCTICLSGIGDSSTPSKSPAKLIVARLSACHHMFCEECIVEWSKQTNTCPIDRIKFNLIELWDTRKDIRVDNIHVSDVIPSQLLPTDDLTYCEICGSCDREDVLLLCDGCNKGYHTDCLRPRIEEIPMDVWYCRHCIPLLGRATRWTEYYDSSQEQENVYVNPQIPEFTEITQAVSDNSSGFEGTGRPRRKRKRYIPPSSPSVSSDGDSESDSQTFIVSSRSARPVKKLPPRRTRKRRKRRKVYKSDDFSQDSQSSDTTAIANRPKRLCRMNSNRRSLRTYQTREFTRKLLRNNSLATSPSSSTNPDVTHIRPHLCFSLRQPLSTQAVFTRSESDADTSDSFSIILNNDYSSNEELTLPDTEPSGNDGEVSDNNTTIQEDILASNTEPSNNLLPCSSHSDNPNSRSLRPRPRPPSRKLRTYNKTNSSKSTRQPAPRRAKLQAEQLLQLKEFISSDESD
ncbi:PHD and RING finger domain-containing protein 1 isoform X1 [Oopsacas minuta]|uniref:PHD and RING finger domain-containing protein 1 isoform X1 n=1 Tax=Oopsacas minuta TaxID=111878 RepID=A0AAV7K1N3_9METZ|nr:PHD and RING finger domain-containing protein 1 isoform X1 [Oopsacas minuta]